jgi:hypothetical protein
MSSSNPARGHPEEGPRKSSRLSRHRRDAADPVAVIPDRSVRGLLNRAGWFLLMGAVAGFVAAFSRQMIHHAGGGSNLSPDHVIAHSEEPLRRDIVYYPRQFLTLVKKANRQGTDLLTDFRTLNSAWKSVCPNKPLRIKWSAVYTPTAIDRISGKQAPPVDNPPVVVDQSNFAELRLHLEKVRRPRNDNET